MFFFPQDELKKNQAKKIFEVIVKNEGMNFLGWREVPVKADVLGSRAVECMPCIMQGFIERPKKVEQGIDFDRKLYIVRRVFEQSADDTYVASLSSRTIAYKGMFLVDQLRLFCRILIMTLRSHWFIPDSVRTRIQAGREHIRTVSLYITVRSIPSVATRTRCVPEKRIWNLSV